MTAEQKPTKLTEKQRRFVEAYMGETQGNATQAARLAGYQGDDKTLSTTGYQTLRIHGVREAIRERVEEDPAVMTREDRQRFLSGVAEGRDIYSPTPDMQKLSIDMRERLKAAELLGKTQGDFIERVEVAGPGAEPLQVTVNYPVVRPRKEDTE